MTNTFNKTHIQFYKTRFNKNKMNVINPVYCLRRWLQGVWWGYCFKLEDLGISLELTSFLQSSSWYKKGLNKAGLENSNLTQEKSRVIMLSQVRNASYLGDIRKEILIKNLKTYQYRGENTKSNMVNVPTVLRHAVTCFYSRSDRVIIINQIVQL